MGFAGVAEDSWILKGICWVSLQRPTKLLKNRYDDVMTGDDCG